MWDPSMLHIHLAGTNLFPGVARFLRFYITSEVLLSADADTDACHASTEPKVTHFSLSSYKLHTYTLSVIASLVYKEPSAL